MARAAKSQKAHPFKLTDRHERFLRNYMAGMPAKHAYLAAGFKPSNAGSINLLKRPEIKARLAALRAVQRIRLNVTLDTLVLDLRRAQDLAVASDNAAAYVNATMGLARLMGFLKDDTAGDVNIFINRPMREPTKEVELTPDQWIAKWSPQSIEKPNGHGNGHDGPTDKG